MTEMPITEEEFYFDSSDGKHKIHSVLYAPAGKPRGVIQMAHGMTEHIGRYREMALYFAENGFVFAGCDHLGHGKTAESPDELGFFAEEDGADTVVSDLYKLTRLLKERYPDLPFFLAGHSMGSFLVRLYALTYGNELTGLVVLGTGGPKKAATLGKAIASLLISLHGAHYRSRFLKKLTDGNNLRRCGKNAPSGAWLSSDPTVAERYKEDSLSVFLFTVSAYYDLYDMVERTGKKSAMRRFPKGLPVILMSGGDDPVGSYGKGPATLARLLKEAGVKDVTLVIYPEARHELQNETCKYRFQSELLEWLLLHLPAENATVKENA